MITVVDPFSSQAAPPVTIPAGQAGRSKQELLASVSASRLVTWLGCRLKFYFRYVAGIRRPTSPALHVGSVVHAVLQQWSLARWRRAPLVGEMVEAVFEKAWVTVNEGDQIAWAEDEPADVVKAAALDLIQTYLRETPIPEQEKPEAVEVSAEMDLARHGLPILVGVLDLVRAGGRIVDFKTTGKSPNAELTLHTHEVQLTGYSLLYREATGRQESALELHHLVKTKSPKLVIVESGPATDAQITRFYRVVESYTRGVDAEEYVPAPGIQCAACEFLKECRSWH